MIYKCEKNSCKMPFFYDMCHSSLAMENAALERVQRRVQQTILEDARQQLQNHLEETKQHQDKGS